MNKTIKIIKHELIKMAKSKGFIIVTLLFPILALTALGGYQLVKRMGIDDQIPTAVTIGVVDKAGGFEDTGDYGEITFAHYESPEEATEALLAGDIDEYFVIPLDYIS